MALRRCGGALLRSLGGPATTDCARRDERVRQTLAERAVRCNALDPGPDHPVVRAPRARSERHFATRTIQLMTRRAGGLRPHPAVRNIGESAGRAACVNGDATGTAGANPTGGHRAIGIGRRLASHESASSPAPRKVKLPPGQAWRRRLKSIARVGARRLPAGSADGARARASQH